MLLLLVLLLVVLLLVLLRVLLLVLLLVCVVVMCADARSFAIRSKNICCFDSVLKKEVTWGVVTSML
jgi:hypothetical protein